MLKALGRITHKDNITFDGLARVSHVTDATDWRVEYPLRGAAPGQRRRRSAWLKGCIELDLTIIPRGGGNGLHRRRDPLSRLSAVINTEKLEALPGAL